MNDLSDPRDAPLRRLRAGRMQPITEAAQWAALSPCRFCGAKPAPGPFGRDWVVRAHHTFDCRRRRPVSRDRRFAAFPDRDL